MTKKTINVVTMVVGLVHFGPDLLLLTDLGKTIFSIDCLFIIRCNTAIALQCNYYVYDDDDVYHIVFFSFFACFIVVVALLLSLMDD